MARRASTHQIEVFESAKQAIASELIDEVRSWDFPKMLTELRATAEGVTAKSGVKNSNPIRKFSRNFLELPGEGCQIVVKWMAMKQEMTEKEIQHILRTLNAVRQKHADLLQTKPQNRAWTSWGKKPAQKIVEKPAQLKETSQKNTNHRLGFTQPKKGLKRKVVEHLISTLNSLVGIVAEADLQSSEIYSGDRMQVEGALTKICRELELKVIFPDSYEGVPLTRRDFAGEGIQGLQTERSK